MEMKMMNLSSISCDPLLPPLGSKAVWRMEKMSIQAEQDWVSEVLLTDLNLYLFSQH